MASSIERGTLISIRDRPPKFCQWWSDHWNETLEAFRLCTITSLSTDNVEIKEAGWFPGPTMTGSYCQGSRTRAGGNVSNPRNSPELTRCSLRSYQNPECTWGQTRTNPIQTYQMRGKIWSRSVVLAHTVGPCTQLAGLASMSSQALGWFCACW